MCRSTEHAEALLLDCDGDVEYLVRGDESGHVVSHRSEGQDAGGRAGEHKNKESSESSTCKETMF